MLSRAKQISETAECHTRVARLDRETGRPASRRRALSRDAAFGPEHEVGLFADRTRHGTYVAARIITIWNNRQMSH